MSCQHEELTWSDCQKDGHDEGCYVSECVSCSLVVPDCEDNENDCQKCLGFIDGGNPFSKYCDNCLDACDCGDCSDTPIEQRPRKID